MARKFSKNELGVEAKTYVKDVKKLNEIDIKADIILLWGLSTSHFSPWDLAEVYAAFSMTLQDDGVMIAEESDRVCSIFIYIHHQRNIKRCV